MSKIKEMTQNNDPCIEIHDLHHIFANEDKVGELEFIDWNNQTISMIIFNRNKIEKLFSRGYVSVPAQRIPMQIENKKIWLSKIGYTYTTDEFIIACNLRFEKE